MRRTTAILAAGLIPCLLLAVSSRFAGALERGEPQPLFEGLGSHNRNVTTTSSEAQNYFNQGLNFLFAFNHDEASRSFRQAARKDPNCAMAYWGLAMACGPHINKTDVSAEKAREAWKAIKQAREHERASTEAERALIEAAAKRYADPQPDDRKPLNEAYAAAMKQVWEKHRKDADIGALYAESLMNLRPWDYWSADGKPQPGTAEVLNTLESVQKFAPDHPLALHLYIHAVEASPHPEKADAAADRLRFLAPGLGHLVHMPSHIDIRRGRWQQAVEANERATAADRTYRQRVPDQGFYRLYMAHNHHMLAFAAMMQGESKRALQAVRTMLDEVPRAWLEQPEQAALLDGFFAAPIEVHMRFGHWDAILKEPEPPVQLPIARTLRHAARAVAYAAKGQLDEARAAQAAFRTAAAKTPKEATFGNNTAADLFAVADALLEGEILFKAGKTEEGLAALRDAVQKEDRLRYDEPPDWITPVRHALGATLLAAGRVAEAEQVYREDLRRWPDNGWSLFGLARSLEMQNQPREAAEVRGRFRRIWERADVELTSSCFCQPGQR